MGMGTDVSGTSSRGQRGGLSTRRILGVALVAASTGGMLAAFACGGTSGRENLPPMPGMDATADTSPIAYVDRSLPELGAPPGADGGDAGSPYPACPPFLPVACNPGTPYRGCPPDSPEVEAGMEIDQEPAVYDDAGNPVPAPDGSACATYPWLGGVAIDHCVTANCPVTGPQDYLLLPPCNWCVEAGISVAGPGVGLNRYDNCMALYACMTSAGCGSNPASCLCGDAATATCDASGPCAQQELAALEPSTTETIAAILNRYTNYALGSPGATCAGALNYVYSCGQSNGCFVDASGY
jgi:hypothetical protein